MTWSVTWNESYPSTSDPANGIAGDITDDKIAVRERLESLLGISNWATADPMKGYQLNLGGGANSKIFIGTTDFSLYTSDGVTQLLAVNTSGAITIPETLTVTNGITVSTVGITLTRGQGVASKYDAGNSSTALTIDWNNSNSQLVTLTGDCTFTFSNPIAGAWYTLELLQDATGSRTVTWPASVLYSNNVAPTLTTTAGKTDLIGLYYNGTNYLLSSGFNF